MNTLEKPTTTGTIIVAKIGGSVLQQEELLNGFISDVHTLVKTGVSIAIVHGGGPSIDAKLAAIKKTPTKIQGLRVTDAETLAIVVEELGSINELIVQKLSIPGIPAVGFKPASNLLFSAKKLVLNATSGAEADLGSVNADLGFVGEIVATNLPKLMACFHQGAVPVVAPLGADKDGIVYNINADHAALAVAAAFGNSKLINITDVPGLLANPADPNSVIKHLTLAEAEVLFSGTSVSGGMLPKLASCINCLKSGVQSVQIIDGHIKNALLKAVCDPTEIGSLISGNAGMPPTS